MRRVLVVLVVLVMVVGLGLWAVQRWDDRFRMPLPGLRADCEVSAQAPESDAARVRLDHDQMAHAATITAVGVRLDMPDQAVVVALATALQESKLRNLPHLGPQNDHDSIGLFQQRPSQGWGSETEISDPRYAAERFYLALREVDGWQELRVTEAAQRVQRSAFPEAYQKWAQDAEVLATALLGHTDAAVTCAVTDDPPVRGAEAAEALGDTLVGDWGEQAPAAQAGPAGLALSTGDPATGWRFAHWLVSHAATHGVTRVHFGGQAWSAADNAWHPVDPAIDHVHAEVAA